MQALELLDLVWRILGGANDRHPGNEALIDSGTDECVDALDQYTGTTYESSNLDAIVFVPDRRSGGQADDRSLVGIGVTLTHKRADIVSTTGSFRAG